MYFHGLIAIAVGISIVIQNGINRELATSMSLPKILVLNSLFTLVFSGIFLGFTLLRPQSQAGFTLSWSGFFAAFCGFVIISGMPLAIARLGALRTVSIVIAVQLVTALLWDLFREGTPASWQRVLGAGVTFLGAWIALAG